MHYWVIIQNHLVRLDQIEVVDLVSQIDGQPSHSLKLALHRLLLSKCDSDNNESSYISLFIGNSESILCAEFIIFENILNI